ncbi:MAG: protease SohB, partial [Methylococcales bacterium]|nr:protease SohB [Methylococcales bacterium]
MSALFAEYGLFLLKTLTIVIAIILILVAVIGAVVRTRRMGGAGGSGEGHIEIRKFNERLEDMQEALSLSLLEPAARKQAEKEKKKSDKAEQKAAKQAAKRAKKQRGKGETIAPEVLKRRVYVMSFDGDIKASAVENLRREITALLTTATPEDEVVIRLESGGGMVAPYGLGASQLDRVRQKKIPLTICVDKVAASGGYMMA